MKLLDEAIVDLERRAKHKEQANANDLLFAAQLNKKASDWLALAIDVATLYAANNKDMAGKKLEQLSQQMESDGEMLGHLYFGKTKHKRTDLSTEIL